MATAKDYQIGTEALADVVQAAIEKNVPAFERGAIPQALIAQIEAQGARAVIDAVDAARAKLNQSK